MMEILNIIGVSLYLVYMWNEYFVFKNINFCKYRIQKFINSHTCICGSKYDGNDTYELCIGLLDI
jgi:hypothetical protein